MSWNDNFSFFSKFLYIQFFKSLEAVSFLARRLDRLAFMYNTEGLHRNSIALFFFFC